MTEDYKEKEKEFAVEKKKFQDKDKQRAYVSKIPNTDNIVGN
jgi:hypothetical protein